jgi:hypothetical protein
MDSEEAVTPQRPDPARGARGRSRWIKAAFITLWFAAWVFIICYVGRDTFDPAVFESLFYVFLSTRPSPIGQ